MKLWSYLSYLGHIMCSHLSRISFPILDTQDLWFLTHNIKGCFSTKCAYKSCISSRIPTNHSLIWKALCKLKIYERIKVFTWRPLSNSLLIRGNFSSRIDLPDISCPFCLNFIETTDHLFISCNFFGLMGPTLLKYPPC